MKHRQIESELRKSAKEYPVVTVIGPRQSGKTTLVKMVFPDHTYVNLEHPEHRRLATSDPKTFLHTFATPAIFDEIQNVPELLSWIQVLVDEHPKDKVLDTGLLGYLLDIETSSQLQRDPLFGNIFENMVVMEFFKYRHNMGVAPNLHFFRDHNQNEVDLIYPHGSNVISIEIKSSRTWNNRFAKGVAYFQKISGQTQKGMVVYDGDLTFENDKCAATNFRNVFTKLQALIASD